VRKWLFGLFTLALIAAICLSYVSKRSPVLSCHAWGFSDSIPKYYVQPEKVFVKPWKGQHHVFGIFMLPGGYVNDKLFKVTVPGEGTFCGVLAYGGTTQIEGVEAKPGYYLMKGLLNTRTALWIISQGKRDELKQKANWRVGYSKIKE
jgi:hypothetical protein